MNRAALALVATLSMAVLAACGNADKPAAAPQGTVITGLAAVTRPALAAASPGLTSATEDVTRIAPKLEQYYFAKGYPRDLKGAKATLAPAGQKVSKGNTLAGYFFDEQQKEFVICIRNSSGAWATYDTAPMATGVSGESGGCPKDLSADRSDGGSGIL